MPSAVLPHRGNMARLLHLPPLLLLLLLCYPGTQQLSAAAVAVAARNPGCATKCGDIEVPYPFGLDPQCAIHGGFQLRCSADANRTTRLFHGGLEVVRLSVEEGKATVLTLNSRQCYERTNNTVDYMNAWLNITDLPYVLSADDNRVVVLGCNSLAYMQSDSYIIGCLSTCKDPPRNGTCAGAGCCQANLPRGVRYYQSFFNEGFNSSSPALRNTPCNYVAITETASFRFTTADLVGTEFMGADGSKTTPVVLEWGIARNTCAEAMVDRAAYACVSGNSECVTNDAGYLCNCSKGYTGNPYVVDGCSDIDECKDNVTYPCAGICRNEPGTFTCSCAEGESRINGFCVRNHKSVWVAPVVVGGSIGLVVLVVAAACAYLIRERRNLQRVKKEYFRRHGGMLLYEEMRSQQQGAAAFRIFREEELQRATDNFDEKRVIGQGGHGKVYKGVLKNEVQVAVKRCVTVDEQQKRQFGREMLILSQVNHRNVVKLLGCCLEVEVPMLVYEFVPNGTLFHLIHGGHGGGGGGDGGDQGRRQRSTISLATRLRIAHESAEALAYLHSCASPPILHGDVKSTNILLDADHAAKVSDFGASILAPTTDKSQFVTFVQGTCGYLDPEYMQTCQLTDRSDVYSFGVVLLELLTRRKAFNLDGPDHDKSLAMAFLSAVKNNRLADILDDQILSNADENDVGEVLEEVAELARQCLEMSGINRPTMKEVADKLDRLRKVMRRHPWAAQENPEELCSLLGEESAPSTGGVATTQDFSVTRSAVVGLEIGR